MATDHDLLIRIETDTKWLKCQFANHLKHHFLISLCSIGAMLTAITALVMFILRSK